MQRTKSYILAVWFLALCASIGVAANVRWTGNAQDVRQVTTIEATGTWATGDTATLTINAKSVTVTLGTAVTPDDVALALAAAVDAGSADEDLAGDETRNVGGGEIPEFIEVDASASGDTLTLRSATAGVPFTITRSEATAGSGALGAVTAVTAATGKNWLNNAANYEAGALPANNDVLYIDYGAVPILYGLDYFRTNTIGVDVYISNDWLGSLGLPPENPAGYREYRTPRYAQLYSAVGNVKKIEWIPGTTSSTAQGNCWIDLTDQQAEINVYARRGSGTTPTVFLAGSNTTSFHGLLITSGAIEIEPDDATTVAGKHAAFSQIDVGVDVPEGSATDPYVVIGRNARLYEAASGLRINSGTVITHAMTKDGADVVPTVIKGGTLELRGNDATNDCHTFEVQAGGTLKVAGASLFDKITLDGGILNARGATGASTVTNGIKAHAGSSILDPLGFIASEFDALGCTPAELTLELPPHKNYTLAPATP